MTRSRFSFCPRLFLLACALALAPVLALPAPAAAQNLVVNPHFSGNLNGWQATGGPLVVYDASRSATADGSGSVAASGRNPINKGSGYYFYPFQCIGGIVPGKSYDFGGAVLVRSAQPQAPSAGNGAFAIFWSENSDCSAPNANGAGTPPRGNGGDPLDTWLTSQVTATAPSYAGSVLIYCVFFNISGPSATFVVNFDDVFFSPTPVPPPPNGLCYVDNACSAGSQQSARDSGSGLCTAVASCTELWKCALGPTTRSCGGGSLDCAFSLDCAEGVSDCAGGGCRPLAMCNDRIKFQGYSQTPGPNQCSCAGNPPPAGCAAPPPTCTPDDQTLCLNSRRFKVQATFDAGGGNAGTAHAVDLTADTGYFWFFNAANVEVTVKVLNGCAVDSRYWVFAGGLTNVKVTLTVTDVTTGLRSIYHNPSNTAFQPIQDTGAFATCP